MKLGFNEATSMGCSDLQTDLLLCEKNGYEIVFLDAPAKQLDEENSLTYIKQNASDADLFVFGTSTPSIKSDVRFASEIKELFPQAFTLLVGTHPSARPEETMSYSSQIDAVAIGEYDNIVLELADTIKANGETGKVRGLCIKDGNTYISKPKFDEKYLNNLLNDNFVKDFLTQKTRLRYFPQYNHISAR